MTALRNMLTRSLSVAPDATIRAHEDPEGPDILTGHFAVFNETTVIDSYWEGKFREQIAPAAFTRTFAERATQIRCIYEHGFDPSFGYKPLGTPEELSEDKVGAFYRVALFDTQLNRDHIVLPAAAGQLGASFAFDVLAEEWDEEPDDGGLPLRTINEVRLYEFGPCPFGAYPQATAGIRTALANLDDLNDEQRSKLAQLNQIDLRTMQAAEPKPKGPPDTGHSGMTPDQRAAQLRELTLETI